MKTISILLYAATSLGLLAQNAAPPPLPPGPLIQARAPDPAKWIVTKKIGSLNSAMSKAESGGNNQALADAGSTQDTITKTGALIHLQRVDGPTVMDVWSNGIRQVLVWPDGKTAGLLTPSGNPDAPNPFYIDFSASDFPGFDWISAEDYTGLTTFADTKCIVYKDKASGQDDATATMAYVDFKTRLPIALQAHGWEFLYEWKPAPSETLSIPSVAERLLNPAPTAASP